MLSQFVGIVVSVQQIYNHLRKWRQRWAKIVRLKDLSGAFWDEDLHMIVLDDEHIIGHTKVSKLLASLTSSYPFLIVYCLGLTRTTLLMLSS
jgi:hypothetical protein